MQSRIKNLEMTNDQLNQNILDFQNQMGIPKAQYDDTIEKLRNQKKVNSELSVEIESYKQHIGLKGGEIQDLMGRMDEM